MYDRGIVNGMCGDRLDHAVLVTGFEINEKGNGYWIVKNSWGSSWGEQGYIRIGTDEKANKGYGVCGIYRCATIPIDDK